MKKLLLLLPLFFIGCKLEERKHSVLCDDDGANPSKAITTFEGIASGPVYMVHKNGTSYLTFVTEGNNRVVLDLSKNDCGVN